MSISIGSAGSFNGFGSVNVSNFTDRLQSKLEQLDSNSDGTIERFEADSIAQNAGLVENLFAQVDTDGDGLITQQEQVTAIDKLEERLSQFKSQSEFDITRLLLQQFNANQSSTDRPQSTTAALAAYQRNNI